MAGVPNYHLKTTHFTFGGSIFSGTELKANTKMETDVKRAGSSTLLYILCFQPISLSTLSSALAKHNEWGGRVGGKIGLKQWWSEWKSLLWGSLMSSNSSKWTYSGTLDRKLNEMSPQRDKGHWQYPTRDCWGLWEVLPSRPTLWMTAWYQNTKMSNKPCRS